MIQGITGVDLSSTVISEPVEWSESYVDWHYYSWSADENRLKELIASNDTVFIAGFLGNQEKLYHYFDKLIALAIDPTEHEWRLRARPKREFGDDEQDIRRRLERYSMHMAKFISSGFITIDNSGPVKQTADRIQRIIAE